MSFSIPIELPLDDDGFLRRECPHCERQFKWRPTPEGESASSTQTPAQEMQVYFCPLCGQGADAGVWWTKEQIEYTTEITKAQVLSPMLQEFQNNLKGLNNRNSGIRVTTTPIHMPMPPALSAEPNDMRRTESPCHPAEPIKVPNDWQGAVYCLVCGSTIQANRE